MKHRIGLTVTDPNHPMVSKRKETIQKTVRVSGDDKEKAITGAIAHYKRKGYKVHDHHYIGTVNEAKDAREYDYEGDMAKSQLRAIIANAQQVHDMLQDDTNMAEWVQSKITLAADYISTVADYMQSEVKEEVELAEAEFEVGHSHHKTTRMTYSRLEAKNAKDAIAKSQKPGHDLVHVYNMDKETFHHPETGRKKSNQYEHVEEAWSMNARNPQRGIKVGNRVRSYDFPGMHDDHYIEGHVVGETPHAYHIRVNRVVRSGKEIPTPAHMSNVEAPKGRGMFNNAYAVHKIMSKEASVAAKPEPAQGAAQTFAKLRSKQ